MTPAGDPALLGAADAADALARGDFSAAELTEACLARIAADTCNAWLHVDAEGARAQARASDERRCRGRSHHPLDGMPVAVKDNIAVAGMPLSLPSEMLPWAESYPLPERQLARLLKRPLTPQDTLLTSALSPSCLQELARFFLHGEEHEGQWGLRFVRTETTPPVRLWRVPLAALEQDGAAALDPAQAVDTGQFVD